MCCLWTCHKMNQICCVNKSIFLCQINSFKLVCRVFQPAFGCMHIGECFKCKHKIPFFILMYIIQWYLPLSPPKCNCAKWHHEGMVLVHCLVIKKQNHTTMPLVRSRWAFCWIYCLLLFFCRQRLFVIHVQTDAANIILLSW